MLIKCRECGKEISDEALFCPMCGCPVKKNGKEPKESFTVAYRSGPGSVVAAVIVIAIAALINLAGSILCFTAYSVTKTGGLLALAIITMIVGVIFLITTIVYISYFAHNARNKGRNCIEYDAKEDKLVLCTLYGEIIKIDVTDYIELRDNFFTDNMLLFTYKTKTGVIKKVKLGYCGNRDQIRANIERARK